NGPHGAIAAARWKRLGVDFREAEVFGIGPHVRDEPRKAVGRRAAQSETEKLLVRIEDLKLGEELLRLPAGFVGPEQRAGVAAGDRGDKLYDALMGDADRAVLSAPSEQRGRRSLLTRPTSVEFVDENVCVSEG